MKLQNNLSGSFHILIAIFLWSSLGVVVRLSKTPVHVFIFYSLIVAVVVQAIILSRKEFRNDITDIRKIKYPLLIGMVALMNSLTFFYAFKHTTIANAVLTHYIAPIIVAFLAVIFLKERITLKIILAIVISSTGLWIMLNGLSIGKGHILGIFFGIISGFTYAMIVILARKYATEIKPLVITFFSNLTIIVLLAPFIREFPKKDLWTFLVMGIVHSTIAPVLYYKGLRNVPANKAAVLGYLEPVCAIILSMIFLNEVPGKNSLYGGILILISGYITVKGNT